MKLGTILTIAVSVAGLTAVIFSFVNNASPYVTLAEAKTRAGDSLHLKGSLDQSSIKTAAMAGTVTFDMKDEEGHQVTVVYTGPPPANMGEATEVVAIGKMDGDIFAAHKLLLKCPSKYESEANAQA